MATDLRKIPGVAPKGRRRVGPRHRDTWTFGQPAPNPLDALLVGSPPPAPGAAGPAPAGVRPHRRPRRRLRGRRPLRARARSATSRVSTSLSTGWWRPVLTSGTLAERAVVFAVKPAKHLHRSTLELDGVQGLREGLRQSTRPAWCGSPACCRRAGTRSSSPCPVPAWALPLPPAFTVDDTPPPIGVPPLLEATGVCEPVTVRGKVEPLRPSRSTACPLAHTRRRLLFAATTDRRRRPCTSPPPTRRQPRRRWRSSPRPLPGGQGVHVTAAAWATSRSAGSCPDRRRPDLRGSSTSRTRAAWSATTARTRWRTRSARSSPSTSWETVAELSAGACGSSAGSWPSATPRWPSGRGTTATGTGWSRRPAARCSRTYGGFTNLAHPRSTATTSTWR